MADEILVNYVVTIDGLKAELKKAQEEFKKTETVATTGIGKTDDAIKGTTKSTGTLITQLKELKKQISLTSDPKEVERLAKAAAVVQKEINSINKQVDTFTKSKYQNVSSAFGDIGYKIKSLDFAGAAKESKKFLAAVQAISFKDVISSIKDVGSTIVTVGKALLSNPLFILAGVIVGISKAAYDMANAMKMVDVQTKTVTEAINEQVKSIRAYSDRVAEVYISLNQGLGKYTQAQADVKRAEIKNNQELLANKQKYSDDLVKLAEELGVNLSKTRNGFFDETYKGDFEDLQNKKRFNIEKQKLDKLYYQQNMAAVKSQLIEKLGIEVQGNLDSIKKSQDYLKQIRDQQAANRAKATEDAIKLREDALRVLTDLDIKADQAALTQQAQTESQKIELARQLAIKEVLVAEKAAIDAGNSKINAELITQNALSNIRKTFDNQQAVLAKKQNEEEYAEAISFAEALGDAEAKQEEKNQKKRMDERKDRIDKIRELEEQAIASVGEISRNVTDQKINDIDRETEKQLSSLKYQLDQKQITQAEYDLKVEALEKSKKEKQDALKKQQFETEKQIALIKIVIATAEATISQFAKTGLAGAVLAEIIGAAQLAIVATQPAPVFEKGGKVKGKRHSAGGTLIEAEVDEMIVNRNDAMKNDKLLHAINEGRADKFIFDHYIAPALKSQQKKNADMKDQSFARNLASSMSLNFKDGNLLDSMKQSRKNERENAIFIVKNLKSKGQNARRRGYV